MLNMRDTEETANWAETWSKTSYSKESHELTKHVRGEEGFYSGTQSVAPLNSCSWASAL